MRLSLAKKITGSYALLTALVLAVFAVQFWFETRLDKLAQQEDQLRTVAVQVRGIAARVQSGVLTRDEAFAIAAAKEAQIAEQALSTLGPAQAELRGNFQRYFAALVAVSSMYLENRNEEGSKRLNSLKTQESAIDASIEQSAAAIRAESAHFAKLLRLFQGAVVLVILALLVMVSWLIRRQVTRPLEHAVDVADAIAGGKFDNVVQSSTQHEMAHLLGALDAMQKKLNEDIEHERALARETQRIKQGLYSSTAAITISGTDGMLMYATPTAQALLKEASGLAFEQLAGRKLTETVLTDPRVHTALTDAVKSGRDIDVLLCGFNLRLSARPILDEAGQSIGRVTTWLNRTQEVHAEAELKTLIDAAVQGDFGGRIPADDKQGFFLDVALGMNQLMDSVAKALDDVAAVLNAVSHGDLSHTIDTDYAGTLGKLKNDSNSTVEQLRSVVGQIKEASDAINTAAKEIAAGNTDLSRRTEQQASNLEETASSMEELSSTVKNNAANAHQAAELAKQSNAAAEKGGEMVGHVVTTMGEIQSSSHKIGDIISVIDSIAFQTNILALNAAVEAARAGEQGRGFAVVASEVRNLAQRSADAAKEIKGLIDESVTRVEGGVRLAHETGDSIANVVDGFHRLAALVDGIAEASREQAVGIDQVSHAISSMDETTQQNAALVEQAAAAAESLEEQAQRLGGMVASFRLQEDGTLAPRPAAVTRSPRHFLERVD